MKLIEELQDLLSRDCFCHAGELEMAETRTDCLQKSMKSVSLETEKHPVRDSCPDCAGQTGGMRFHAFSIQPSFLLPVVSFPAFLVLNRRGCVLGCDLRCFLLMAALRVPKLLYQYHPAIVTLHIIS